MKKKSYSTPYGDIVYWTNTIDPERRTLVFLPGLTADHRLFVKQIPAFAPNYNVLVWDAPGHGESRPFELNFNLNDKAIWLHEILEQEQVKDIVLIGQSMGGYVSQCYLQIYPGTVAGFISIDSAPLQRSYVTAAEIWMLKNVTPVYKIYPWNALKRDGANGCAETAYGKALMRRFMDSYEKDEYAALAGHGYGMLAEAMAADLPYEIDCPALLICGEKDKAGSTKHYNRVWSQKGGMNIAWIAGAGHNSNTDRPELVNQIIQEFLDEALELNGTEAIERNEERT